MNTFNHKSLFKVVNNLLSPNFKFTRYKTNKLLSNPVFNKFIQSKGFINNPNNIKLIYSIPCFWHWNLIV